MGCAQSRPQRQPDQHRRSQQHQHQHQQQQRQPENAWKTGKKARPPPPSQEYFQNQQLTLGEAKPPPGPAAAKAHQRPPAGQDRQQRARRNGAGKPLPEEDPSSRSARSNRASLGSDPSSPPDRKNVSRVQPGSGCGRSDRRRQQGPDCTTPNDRRTTSSTTKDEDVIASRYDVEEAQFRRQHFDRNSILRHSKKRSRKLSSSGGTPCKSPSSSAAAAEVSPASLSNGSKLDGPDSRETTLSPSETQSKRRPATRSTVAAAASTTTRRPGPAVTSGGGGGDVDGQDGRLRPDDVLLGFGMPTTSLAAAPPGVRKLDWGRMEDYSSPWLMADPAGLEEAGKDSSVFDASNAVASLLARDLESRVRLAGRSGLAPSSASTDGTSTAGVLRTAVAEGSGRHNGLPDDHDDDHDDDAGGGGGGRLI